MLDWFAEKRDRGSEVTADEVKCLKMSPVYVCVFVCDKVIAFRERCVKWMIFHLPLVSVRSVCKSCWRWKMRKMANEGPLAKV